MSQESRRQFLQAGLTLGAAGLILPAWAGPTEASGGLGSYESVLAQEGGAAQPPVAQPPAGQPMPPVQPWRVTEDNILGPYHRANAPFRGKVTPPLAAGTVLLIRGQVFGHDTRRPLANAIIDVWQADMNGRYDNDDPRNPPAANVFVNRCRLVTDDSGYYEYETIHPGAYQVGPNAWRPPHIHYLVRHPGYRQLVTQLYFRGDPHQREDQFIRASLVIDLAERRVGNATYKTGTFPIVLAPMPR
jgi:catechol 1,2-dioxygenase